MAKAKPKARLRAYRKADKIRRKIRDGRDPTIAELEWLKTYEEKRQAPGRPTVEAVEDGQCDDGDEPTGDEGDDGDELPDGGEGDEQPEGDATAAPDPGAASTSSPVDHRIAVDPGPSPDTAAAPIPGPRPRVGRPPRVRIDTDDDAKEKKADWRAKYKAGGKAAGREATVVTIAEQWKNVLGMLAGQLTAIGVHPIVDPETLFPAIVLTVDDFLPASVELRPEHIAVGGSTALLIQRFMRRTEIAEHAQREHDKEAFRARNAERRERAEQAAASPEPVPAAAPDPVPVPTVVPPTVAGIPTVDRPMTRDDFNRAAAEMLAADPSVVM